MSLQSFQYNLRPKDSFEILYYFNLTQPQHDVINRLYTPLIGTSAIGLYYYLIQFAVSTKESTQTHYTIMNELKINLLEFRKSMDILEGIGLIKSFVNHSDNLSHYVYELVQPPTAYQFFNDPMLSIFLFREVENKRFQDLKKYFEINKKDLSEFQHITKKFTDVFKIPDRNISVQTVNLKSSSSYSGINLSDESFDFEMLKELLQQHFISTEIVNKDAKELIIQLATLYGLSVDDMKRVILNSITSAQTLSFEEMRKQARSYYLIEHEQQLPKLEVKTNQYDNQADKSLTTNSKNNEDNWLDTLETVSPIDMLVSWSGSEPTYQQKLMIEELVEREKLPIGVINILLQFVMLKNDMMLPKKYILEIASNWKKLGINTAKQAYEKAIKMNENKSSNQSNQRSKQYQSKQFISREKTPKWLENRDKDNSNSQDKKIDENFESDRQAFQEQLKKDWGEN